MVISNVLGVNTKGIAFGSMAVQLCRIQKGLGGDTAFIQASTTQRFFLKQTNIHATLGSPLGAEISAGAATQD